MRDYNTPQIVSGYGYGGDLLETIEETPKPVPQPKPRTVYIYSDCDSAVILRYRGHYVDRQGCYNDYYGPDTDIREAVKEAEETVKEYGIRKDDPMVIEVVRTVKKVRRVKTGQKIDFGAKKGQDEYANIGEVDEEPTRKVVWTSAEGYLKEPRDYDGPVHW